MTREQLLEYFEIAADEIRENIKLAANPDDVTFIAVIPPTAGIPAGTSVALVYAIGGTAKLLIRSFEPIVEFQRRRPI